MSLSPLVRCPCLESSFRASSRGLLEAVRGPLGDLFVLLLAYWAASGASFAVLGLSRVALG
eukprot:4723059-Pyramimonas_sp.AAC.1